MKKVLSYILILFILFANLFAPLSVGLSEKNTPKITQNIARAEDGGMNITVQPTRNSTSIEMTIKVAWSTIENGINKGIRVRFKDPTGKMSDIEKIFELEDSEKSNEPHFVSFTGLTPSTSYQISTEAREIDRVYIGVKGIKWNTNSLWVEDQEDYKQAVKEGTLWSLKIDSTVRTLDEGATDFIPAEKQEAQNTEYGETIPSCGIDGLSDSGTVMGCVAQFVYYALFVPTSYFFALSGVFFDNTFAYSVQDNSYRSSFVVQGWGLVRDFCNLFFIFILLYIAIGTTLSLHGINTKGVIINVVIIGLFINFSLFATQVIIDASNVTARVFYNSDTIKVTVKGQTDNTAANATDGGSIVAAEKDNGVINLSEALVNKVNPQNIIINSKKVNSIPIKGGDTQVTDSSQESNMGAGTFILITLMAIGINVVGIIVFLSVGLIFVSRVIGLWLAMILSPLAFFTYILPSMSGTKMIGWKNWWPETLKLAFLAPVFMFFMYIILKFLELDLIADPMSKDGLSFFIATLIPFAFIMILMMKAKSIAKDMSGELGQQITGGVSAAGGMILGGAALGAAFLGRSTIGAFTRTASTGESANQRYARGESRNNWDRIKGATAHYGTLGLLTRAQQSAGTRINADQTRVEGAAHARHALDENSQTRYHKNYNELTQPERQNIHDMIDRNIVSRQQFGNRAYNQLTNAEQTAVTAEIARLQAAGQQVDHGSAHMITEARRKQGIMSNIVQSSRTGSFDVRNLSKLVVGEQDHFLNKFATGVTSSLASGMRHTLKQSSLNYGEGQKDFVKDLGHTISEALKSASVKVDLSHVGQEHKEDSHGGHGGGGGHH